MLNIYNIKIFQIKIAFSITPAVKKIKYAEGQGRPAY
jgi:hypothetical protein